MSKTIHVYLFRGILFSFLITLTKIFEHKLFFSLEAYPAIRLTYFSRLSSLLSGMPVQVKRYIIFTWSNYCFIYFHQINQQRKYFDHEKKWNYSIFLACNVGWCFCYQATQIEVQMHRAFFESQLL